MTSQKGFASQPGALLWTGVLSAGLLGLLAAIILIDDPLIRAGACFVVLAPLISATVRLAHMDFVAVRMSMPRAGRRFHQLRSRTTELLSVIKRLNWLAVDGERGVRSARELTEEMDAIEARLGVLVAEIREVAGKASPAPAGEGPAQARAQDTPATLEPAL